MSHSKMLLPFGLLINNMVFRYRAYQLTFDLITIPFGGMKGVTEIKV